MNIKIITIIILLSVGFEENIGQNATIKIFPAETIIEIYSVKELFVQIDDINSLRAYSIKLSYDSEKLRCTNISKGSFFSNWQTLFYSDIDSSENMIRIDEAILGEGYQNGSGDLVKIEFQGIGAGDVNINFTNSDFRDTLNNVIPVQTEDGIVHIVNPTIVEQDISLQYSNTLSIFPNPFNSSTNIEYTSSLKLGQSEINIYSLTGEIVFRYEERSAGSMKTSFTWNGISNFGEILPSGIYIVVLSNEKFYLTSKIILLK